MADNVSLKWDDFNRSVTKSFGSLRNEKDFFDVTLVTDDEVQVSAHKLILSACSPFFKNILRKNQHSHPLLYLSGITSGDLHHVMDYVYNGEVTVQQQQVDSFMKVSQKLQLHGLRKEEPKAAQKQELVNFRTVSQKLGALEEAGTKIMTRTSAAASLSLPMMQEINFMQFDPGQAFSFPEDKAAKAPALGSMFSAKPPAQSSDGNKTPVPGPLFPSPTPSDDSKTDYFSSPAKIKQDDTSEQIITKDSNKGKNKSKKAIATAKDESKTTIYTVNNMEQIDKKLGEFSEKVNGVYTCKVCKKTAINKTNHYFHIETHMDGLFFQCDQCERTTKTRNAMRKHYGFYHQTDVFEKFGLRN